MHTLHTVKEVIPLIPLASSNTSHTVYCTPLHVSHRTRTDRIYRNCRHLPHTCTPSTAHCILHLQCITARRFKIPPLHTVFLYPTAHCIFRVDRIPYDWHRTPLHTRTLYTAHLHIAFTPRHTVYFNTAPCTLHFSSPHTALTAYCTLHTAHRIHTQTLHTAHLTLKAVFIYMLGVILSL
jgi:hypothetical protein